MPIGKSLQKRIQRMFSMGRAEFQDRSRQYAAQRWDAALHWLGRDWKEDLRHEAAQRPANFFFNSAGIPPIIAILRDRLPAQAEAIIQRAERIVQHRFDLLGYENVDYGPAIDWHLDKIHGKLAPGRYAFRLQYLSFSEVGDSKVTWELSRHQHLVVLAKAYLLTSDERFTREIVEQWYGWQKQNPYPVGINWASSLEVAFRSLSWIWLRALLQGNPAMPQIFWTDMSHAQAVNGRHLSRYLSTYFSPNTHLLGEAMALFYIGTLCPELARANEWRDLGWRIMIAEARSQVREDGFYFEQSVYYHVYALEMFLHSGLLAARNDLETPPDYVRTVEKMCDALALLSRTGVPARSGDDDGGRLLDGQRNRTEHMTDPLATGAAVFARGDFKFLAGGLREDMLWLLGPEGVRQYDELKSTRPSMASASLAASGFCCMSSAQPVAQQLIVDVGPQGAGSGGHGHADALNIQLLCGDRVLLQDPGTFEYIGTGPERESFRITAAHSTLLVDGQGQSLPRGPFGWERLTQTRQEAWVAGEFFDLLRASHDGFAEEGITHRRWVFHLHGRFWFVRDLAEGAGTHKLDVNWHLGSGLQPDTSGNRFFAQEGTECGLALVGVEGSAWQRGVQPSWWSPAYGQKEESWTVRFHRECQLPAECATVVMPLASRAQASGCLRFDLIDEVEDPEVSGYLYQLGQEQHGFFFRRGTGPWLRAGWASDAEFLYYRADSRGLREIYFHDGSYVEAGGKRLASANETVPYCQFVTQGNESKVVSPWSARILLHEELSQVAFGPDALASMGETRRTDG